ncbi:hypothetical protein AAMO2058_001359600 [Amorphochlora amoebiformis]
MVSDEIAVQILTNGRALLTAVLAGLLAGIALVFVRKERRRNRRTTKIIKQRRGPGAGAGGRWRRRVERKPPSKLWSILTMIYTMIVNILDVLTSKALYYLQGCPGHNPSESYLMELGESSSSDNDQSLLLKSKASMKASSRTKKKKMKTKNKSGSSSHNISSINKLNTPPRPPHHRSPLHQPKAPKHPKHPKHPKQHKPQVKHPPPKRTPSKSLMESNKHKIKAASNLKDAKTSSSTSPRTASSVFGTISSETDIKSEESQAREAPSDQEAALMKK